MSAVSFAFPKLKHLPASLPLDGAVRIELQEGVPIFRASAVVQQRIEDLLAKQKDTGLTPQEEEDLDRFEEIDDYLSFLNRLVRDQHSTP